MIQAHVLAFLIRKCPGQSEFELASAIHGDEAYQQQVNQDLGMLVSKGAVDRKGLGGVEDPYRYHPK